MKLLIVAGDTIPHIGGKSTHILDLMDALDTNDIKHEIISMSNLETNKKFAIKALLIPFKIYNNDLYQLYYRKLWALILNRKVLKYCIEKKPDIISVQDPFAAFAIKKAVRELNIPVVLTMHTYFGIEESLDKKMNKSSKIAYNRNMLNELSSLTVVNKVITVDNRICNHVKNTIEDINNSKVKKEDVSTIINFTNTSVYKPYKEKGSYKELFLVEKNKFVICCARRLVEKNGVLVLVKSMKYIDDDNIVLLIAGDGPQKILIEKYVNENSLENKVKFLGSLNNENIKKLYFSSDISVVPSVTVNGLQEATSISAIEAMACGLPTIASNIGGLKQLIEHEFNGLLVEENNASELAKQIVRLKNDKELYRKLSANSSDYINSNHSHINAAKEYLKLYASLL